MRSPMIVEPSKACLTSMASSSDGNEQMIRLNDFRGDHVMTFACVAMMFRIFWSDSGWKVSEFWRFLWQKISKSWALGISMNGWMFFPCFFFSFFFFFNGGRKRRKKRGKEKKKKRKEKKREKLTVIRRVFDGLVGWASGGRFERSSLRELREEDRDREAGLAGSDKLAAAVAVSVPGLNVGLSILCAVAVVVGL